MEVSIYSPEMEQRWDTFVEASRCPSFLFKRRYMDYHSDRFEDFSLIVADDDGKLCALLPAVRIGSRLSSHAGLTYGGFLTPRRHFDAQKMLDMWQAVNDFLLPLGFIEILYKAVPHIYQACPAEDDLYAIFRLGGRMESVQMSSVVDMAHPVPFDEKARYSVRHAQAAGVEVEETTDFAPYWQMLADLLRQRYGAKPVHTLDEIRLLHSRFPENIRLFQARKDGELLGGVVVYYSGMAAHSQYTASTEEGRRLRVLPLVYQHILDCLPTDMRYFDFGTSNEHGGLYLNAGLIKQKYAMGGRPVAYQTYIVPVR